MHVEWETVGGSGWDKDSLRLSHASIPLSEAACKDVLCGKC